MDPQLVKKIETEQKFAAAIYRSFRQIRYGLTPCCDQNLDSIIIENELCSWQEIMPPEPAIVCD